MLPIIHHSWIIYLVSKTIYAGTRILVCLSKEHGYNGLIKEDRNSIALTIKYLDYNNYSKSALVRVPFTLINVGMIQPSFPFVAPM